MIVVILPNPMVMPLQKPKIPVCRLHKVFQRNLTALDLVDFKWIQHGRAGVRPAWFIKGKHPLNEIMGAFDRLIIKSHDHRQGATPPIWNGTFKEVKNVHTVFLVVRWHGSQSKWWDNFILAHRLLANFATFFGHTFVR